MDTRFQLPTTIQTNAKPVAKSRQLVLAVDRFHGLVGRIIMDLVRFITEPRPCSYLDNETAQLEYRVPMLLDESKFSELLRRGWRRFGRYVFRPQCPACSKCRGIRIPLNSFRSTKSQRKALKRNQHIEVTVGPPSVSDDHIDLYNAYHDDMTARRGWPRNRTSPSDYYESFIGGDFDFAREFQYREDGRLVGVSLVDVTDCGTSSVYFYHEPEWRNLNPGTYSILKEIEYSQSLGLEHLYLGYWIGQNVSMDYKARFGPHELLEAYIEEDVEPVWKIETS
jgi:leucyl-tRNA---protein transferase